MGGLVLQVCMTRCVADRLLIANIPHRYRYRYRYHGLSVVILDIVFTAPLAMLTTRESVYYESGYIDTVHANGAVRRHISACGECFPFGRHYADV